MFTSQNFLAALDDVNEQQLEVWHVCPCQLPMLTTDAYNTLCFQLGPENQTDEIHFSFLYLNEIQPVTTSVLQPSSPSPQQSGIISASLHTDLPDKLNPN